MANPEAVRGAPRCGLYGRVSTTRQELDLQLEELRQLAARRGWAVVSEYMDVISGTSTRRPGLDRLLADAHAARIDVVAVWKLERLGRSLVHLVQVIDELLGKGIHLVSATEPRMDSTTPQGRLLRNIFASVAEYERELIRARVRVGQLEPGPRASGSGGGPGWLILRISAVDGLWVRAGGGSPGR
jgi:DNA invertase Pin-like site-specific DNA recombinase